MSQKVGHRGTCTMTVHWSHLSVVNRKTRRKENVSSTLLRKKSVTAKKAMTNRTKSEFTSSHCRVAAKTNFLLLFPARFAHARYSSRMIDRFLNWGDHGKPKSGKIKGRCWKSYMHWNPEKPNTWGLHGKMCS